MRHKEVVYPDADSWCWKEHGPFAQTVVMDDQVFIGGQQSLDIHGQVVGAGDIAAQTRNVFESMKWSLARIGLELSDLVRLNTYYVFDGDDADATRYWEDMTRVRLEYFPDPGPAATAVRVRGMPYRGQLIQIEGVALRGESRKNRQRIMPDGSWDWSIAVPLSQGWKVGNRIFVGGQISADKSGAPVDVGDVDAQTRNIYAHIGNVLAEAGASFSDIVHIKVCPKYDSRDPATGVTFADRIMQISEEFIDGSAPTMTTFGVDLLYPGLDLEIDVMAIVDQERKVLVADGPVGQYQPEAFSVGICAAGEIHIAGQTALDDNTKVLAEGDFRAQCAIVFDRIQRTLAQADACLQDVVRLSLFLAGADDQIEDHFHQARRLWAELCPHGYPALTAVHVHELARPGLLFQADCIALQRRDRK